MEVRLMHQPVIVEGSHRMGSDRAFEVVRTEAPFLAGPSFGIAVATSGDHTRVTLTGEIDLVARAELASALCGVLGSGRRVIVDLGQVTLIDGGGVGLVMQLQRRARAAGGDLILVHPRGVVARVLAILDPERSLVGEAS
jgi:anti-anti-sigma factor